MQMLTKKTTILFSPDLYQQLQNAAKVTKTSVAELIRRAVTERYFLSDKKSRLKAVEELSKIGGSASSWEAMEKEIIAGKLRDIL